MTDTEFRGCVIEVAEKEFAASATHQLALDLCREWQEAGSPKGYKAWIRTRLKDLFQAVDKRPAWVRKDCPDWQYHDGRPMMFLGQLDLPEFRLPSGQVASKQSLYVFGAAEPVQDHPGSWTLLVKTVTDMKL